MDYAVLLYFDKKSTKIIEDLQREISKINGNLHTVSLDIRPHITLSSFESDSIDDFIESFTSYLDHEKISEVTFSGYGLFTSPKNVIYLNPVVDMKLVDINQRFFDYYDSNSLAVGDYYAPGSWVPHCTLASRLSEEEVLKSIPQILSKFQLEEVAITEVGVIQAEPLEEIFNYKLRQ